MAFNGDEAGVFSLKTASIWTKNYRLANPTGVRAHFFGKVIIEQILAQEGCVGIRMFYALDNDDVQQMIIVGTDVNENDLINGIIGEMSVPCPNNCGVKNSLNS
jgi:hypothetical protein